MNPLVQMASEIAGCDLSDDAVIYSGSACWDDWRNHVPLGVQACWQEMTAGERAAVFLCCVSVTKYQHMQKPAV